MASLLRFRDFLFSRILWLVWGLALLSAVSVAQQDQAGRDVAKELPGLHNVHRPVPNVYLGSEPHSEAAFRELQKLGVKTIVSVDGAIPNVALAKKHGLRYVHIPIGYDAIPKEAGLALTRVGREANEPIYVHCHHGRHRGPAAAAVLCLSTGSITSDQAMALMTSAGTGKDYVGLWRDVRAFQAPDANVRLPELVEVATVESITAAMAKIDRAFDNLKLCAKSGWMPPSNHPDLVPAAEARLVQEGLHESSRHLSADHSHKFRAWLQESDQLANELCEAIKARDNQAADKAVSALQQSCVNCHVKYRNN